MSNKKICPICGDGDEIAKTLTVNDIDTLSDKIKNFIYQDDMSCDMDDVLIVIKYNGDVVLSGEFRTNHEEKIKFK